MSVLTEVLKLFKYDPATDGDMTFNIGRCMNDNWDKLDAAILLAIAAAGAYNPEESYAVGDYCTYKGKLRKCSTAIPTGETWTEAHWTTTTVAAELAELSSQLSNKVGNQAKEIPSSNCDNINDLSLYRVHSGTENAFQTGEGGILLSMPWDINRQQQLSANPVGTTLAHRCKNGGIWGSWIPIANATPPQEFSLPLAVGIDTYGKSTYWKTQEGICFVNIAAHSSSDGIMDQSIIATLPAGFRPDMVTYAAGHGFTNAGTRIPLDVEVNPDGTIQIWVASTLEYCSCFVGFVAAG